MPGGPFVRTLKEVSLIFFGGGLFLCLVGSFEMPQPKTAEDWLVRFIASGLSACYLWGLMGSPAARRVTVGVVTGLFVATAFAACRLDASLIFGGGIAAGFASALSLWRWGPSWRIGMTREAMAMEAGRQWQRDQAKATRAPHRFG